VPLTDGQRAEAADVLAGMAPAEGETDDGTGAFGSLVETRALPGVAPAVTVAAYYAARGK